GPNESYDAADYQNMFLGLMPQDDQGHNPGNTRVLPSLHRPELINYWQAVMGTSQPLAMNPDVLRRIMLRPNWLDHPFFDGSNAEYASALATFRASLSDPTAAATAAQTLLNIAIKGPWDVDNDNDGQPDSVWSTWASPPCSAPTASS